MAEDEGLVEYLLGTIEGTTPCCYFLPHRECPRSEKEFALMGVEPHVIGSASMIKFELLSDPCG